MHVSCSIIRREKARDNVLAVVSHDLRSPLSAIDLSTQLMARDREQQHAKEIAAIFRSITAINQLIEDLLKAST
jgi:K+-sensing histidine kinase KdpD